MESTFTESWSEIKLNIYGIKFEFFFSLIGKVSGHSDWKAYFLIKVWLNDSIKLYRCLHLEAK